MAGVTEHKAAVCRWRYADRPGAGFGAPAAYRSQVGVEQHQGAVFRHSDKDAAFAEDSDVWLVRYVVAAPGYCRGCGLARDATVEALDAPVPGVGDVGATLDVTRYAYRLLELADVG